MEDAEDKRVPLYSRRFMQQIAFEIEEEDRFSAREEELELDRDFTPPYEP